MFNMLSSKIKLVIAVLSVVIIVIGFKYVHWTITNSINSLTNVITSGFDILEGF